MKSEQLTDSSDYGIGPDFTIAFQPIVDLEQRQVFAHEALVRGVNGEGAYAVLGQMQARHRFAFHEACRVNSVEMASALGMQSRINLNVMPNDIARPAECFRTAIRTNTLTELPYASHSAQVSSQGRR